MADNERMKQRLREHLDTVLEDAPASARKEELCGELYQNMCDRYDDLIAEGRSPAAAYNAAVAGLGDISPLLEELTDQPASGTTLVGDENAEPSSPHAEQRRAAWKRYRTRSSILIPIAVALYILSLIPVILLEKYNEHVGVVLMFACVAAATGILIFNHMSRPIVTCPASDTPADKAEREDRQPEGSPAAKLCKAITGALWMITVLVYLAVSFLTMRWELTWMIFLIAVAIDNIIEALFDLSA